MTATEQTIGGAVGASARRSLALLVVTVGATTAVAFGWHSPLSTALVLGFLLLVPGLALTDALGIEDPLLRWALAAGSSLAVETAAALALLYAGQFGTKRALAIVVAFTVLALAVGAGRSTRRTA